MLTDTLKQEIQQAYSQFLKSKDLKPRYGQRLMIAEIAKALAAIETDAEGKRVNDAGVVAIEAGTGTGKTVSYLLAALPIAKALGKKVVISTATITLQEQIIYRDLPDVLHHSGLSFRFALAKGRGRYVCLSKLDQKQHQHALQESLFAEEGLPSNDDEQQIKAYQELMQALFSKEWNGERDAWSEQIDDAIWQNLTADRNECMGRRCQYASQCGFMKARENMGIADCIVANHDLVMADLALGGGAILPAPEETIYIFDEAHHLPEIALRHFTGQLRVNSSLHWSEQSIKQLQEITRNYSALIDLLDKLAALPAMLLEVNQFYKQLKPMVESLLENLEADSYDMQQGRLPHYRFEHGAIPAALADMASSLVKSFQPVIDDLSDAHEIIAAHIEANQTAYSMAQLEALYAEIGMMLNNAERQYGLWQAYSKEFKELPDSRWIQLVQSGDFMDYELAASPLLAAETLHRYLWHSCYSAILTSATLTALGEFNRLRMQSGLPHYARTCIVPSPFDYPNNAEFVVPNLQFEPNHPQHSHEVVALFDRLVSTNLGVLVLFSSRRQMEETYELLSVDWQDKILCQTHMSRKALLETHKERVDAKQQSILFGMASLAEGVDLPGEYCTHVIIDKLPFAVPNDPVSAALDEWLKDKGRNAFVEVSLPEVSQKLVQACGRLIRNESDKGRITLLDKRILTKRYGKQLLDTLPPFKKILG